MGRTDFFEDRSFIEGFFAKMKELMTQGKDELFLEYNTVLSKLFFYNDVYNLLFVYFRIKIQILILFTG